MNKELSDKTREALHEYQNALQMQRRAQWDLHSANEAVERTRLAYEQAFEKSNPVVVDGTSE